MRLNEYQQDAFSTCTETSNNFSYLILGFLGEAGELLNETNCNDFLILNCLIDCGKQAKRIRKGEILPENITVTDKFADELGDVLWFVAVLAKKHGLTLEQIANINLSKLQERKLKNQIINHV